MKKELLYLIIIVILAGLLVHTCNRKRQLKDQTNNITEFLNDSIQHYKNKHGQEVAYKTALQGEKASLQLLLSKQIDSTGQLKKLAEKWKNIAAAGNITTIVKIDSIPIPYEVPVPYEFTRKWIKKTPFYSLTGTSTHTGVTIDELQIPNTLSFIIGDKRTGLFKTHYRIEAVNSNPYITTTGLDAFTHKTNERILSLSLQAGYGMTLKGFSPYVGAGVDIDLLRLFGL